MTNFNYLKKIQQGNSCQCNELSRKCRIIYRNDTLNTMVRNVIGGNTYNCQTLTHDELTYIFIHYFPYTKKDEQRC